MPQPNKSSPTRVQLEANYPRIAKSHQLAHHSFYSLQSLNNLIGNSHQPLKPIQTYSNQIRVKIIF